MSAAATSPGSHPLYGPVTALLLAGMLVFIYTVGIGILNGVDAVDFDRQVLLSHVHSGTLGWITIGVFAASLWLFGANDTTEKMKRSVRVHTIMAIVTLPLFAVSFAFTSGTVRAVLGLLALLTILAFTAWAFRRIRSVEMTAPHLGFLAALVTSVTGGLIGVLLAAEIAQGWNLGPDGMTGAHPATMVVGFLTPIGMALGEWGLRRGNLERLTTGGKVQVAFPFVGGVLLMFGVLFDITPLPPIAALLNLVGIIILFVRMRRELLGVRWLRPSLTRYAAVASIALLLSTIFLNVLAARYEGDLDQATRSEILALDHTMFIGVLTMALFVLLHALSSADARFPKLDHVVFFGIIIGIVGFVVAQLADATPVMHSSTPIMGLSILLGMALSAYSLLSGGAHETTGASRAPQPTGAR